MLVERTSFSIVVSILLFVCSTLAAINNLEHEKQEQQQQQQLFSPTPNEDEQRRENEAARDIMRYLFLVFRNNYPVMNGRNTLGGIPFRPVRRMGSEFLGKRSDNSLERSVNDLLLEEKRALGSEFLGKRRLGSEFLGKRGEGYESMDNNNGQWTHDLNADKRALGSEFLGKRRPNLWDWSWKRGLGSEFLGKRVLGSEFLGKRSVGEGEGPAGGQEVLGPATGLEILPSESGRI